ncbi:MAG: sigma-54-dependent Fis family transcriptional regulator [Bacteroidetes bacterium]|nr:sigma-54-dependent Fis family transcriptional regulator [Bacteroidota bacterium]
MSVQQVKQRFGIIGNSSGLNRAGEVATQVAPTDISVLVIGESGVGKEIIPQIIHGYSSRKHNEYIAVNCGAIPEGTIDSELFGHEKGSFTGAQSARKGYFEVADGGTIFLDEVAELPLQTQVRLLRVLETGEFLKVGSSKVIKTNVRIIAATNVNIPEAIKKGKFREDLYYRLSTIPISLPPLRERNDDIHLIFRKFAADFADKYRMPAIRLSDESIKMIDNYRWPGNIRQLKNITEQISVIEKERIITPEILRKYLPKDTGSNLPMVIDESSSGKGDLSDREILYKVLFDMRRDVTEMKKIISGLLQNNSDLSTNEKSAIISKYNNDVQDTKGFAHPGETQSNFAEQQPVVDDSYGYQEPIQDHIEIEESLSLEEREIELIKKALIKHNNKRKYASRELGISERTLYRKIKEYDIKK